MSDQTNIELIKCKACDNSISSEAETCPACGHPTKISQPHFAKLEKKRKSSTAGCLIQIIAFLLIGGIVFYSRSLIFGIIGLTIFLVIFGFAGDMGLIWVCSSCGNTAEKGAKICPICKADFTKNQKR